MKSYKHILSSPHYWFWLIHFVLIGLFAGDLIWHLPDFMARTGYDGLKNYFTLRSYIAQPEDAGFWKYTAMQYPYGDYVWFTDNSPLIALILRFVHLYITPADIASIPVFNALMLSNLVLAAIVAIPMLRKLIKNEWLVMAGTLVLIWSSPQLIRLFAGTMNLSLSVFYFLCISLTIDLLRADSVRRMCVKSGWLLLVIFIATTMHMYYVVMLGLPVLLVIGLHMLLYLKQRRALLTGYICSMAIIGSSVILILLVLRFTDGYYMLRAGAMDGSDVSNWQLRLFHLYKAKEDVNTIPFIGGRMKFDTEQGPYLGAFFWYGAAFLLLYVIVDSIRRRKLTLNMQRSHWAWLLAGIFTLFAAMGMHIHIGGARGAVDNIFSPLYYLHFFTDAVAQFRCYARIGWWVFYMAIIALLLGIDRFAIPKNSLLSIVIVVSALLLSCLDLTGTWRYAVQHQEPSVFRKSVLESLPDMEFSQFQAILPIPYYNVGSENYAYTLDDHNDWSKYTFQLQLKSNLPLMSSKMSRTPDDFAVQLMDIFLGDGQEVISALNEKPVLVVYHSTQQPMPAQEPAMQVSLHGKDILEKYLMEEIAHDGDVKYFRWKISRAE